jgi:predicted molibdopterin-dependent oxidoreductase YjgC
MGTCFDCLVVVDGVPNTRACMTWVSDGMRVSRQDGLVAVAG